MKLGDINIDFFSHVCFQFKSKQGGVIITDPFFADGFEFEGHFEKYLTGPDVKIEDITTCDAVFVSHIHGDHFDPEAVSAIHKQCGCKIIAPADVLAVLENMAISKDFLIGAREGATFQIKDMTLKTYGGYDPKHKDEMGNQNKFSLIISSNSTSLFYSGDCHSLPPGVKGMNFDAMFCWPLPDDAKLQALCSGLNTGQFVMMHCDRFDPGQFICNMDMAREKERVERVAPHLKVIIPQRIQKM